MQEGGSEHTVALLAKAGEGDRVAADQLLPLVYGELRRLATSQLAGVHGNWTLQPTALVHETYLRLVGNGDPGWNGRAHFMGAVARAMRHVVVDHARARGRLKRGGGRARIALTDLAGEPSKELDLDRAVVLDGLLERLEHADPRKADVVSLRFFAGLTHEEIARVLNVTLRTVERDWRFARAWLQREIEDDAVLRDDGVG